MRWCLVNFQCRGRPTILITVGQGPIALAVGAGVGCLDIFTLIYPFSSFSLSLGDGSIQTEILSQRAVKPKTTNQPTCWFNVGSTLLKVISNVAPTLSQHKISTLAQRVIYMLV